MMLTLIVFTIGGNSSSFCLDCSLGLFRMDLIYSSEIDSLILTEVNLFFHWNSKCNTISLINMDMPCCIQKP